MALEPRCYIKNKKSDILKKKKVCKMVRLRLSGLFNSKI